MCLFFVEKRRIINVNHFISFSVKEYGDHWALLGFFANTVNNQSIVLFVGSEMEAMGMMKEIYDKFNCSK